MKKRAVVFSATATVLCQTEVFADEDIRPVQFETLASRRGGTEVTRDLRLYLGYANSVALLSEKWRLFVGAGLDVGIPFLSELSAFELNEKLRRRRGSEAP